MQRGNRFQAAPGASVGAGASYPPQDGTRRRRSGSDGNGSDSANEAESMLGGGVGASERPAHRVQVNGNPAFGNAGNGRSQQSVNRPTPRSFSFGQNIPKGAKFNFRRVFLSHLVLSPASAMNQPQRKSGTFRPAGFNR